MVCRWLHFLALSALLGDGLFWLMVDADLPASRDATLRIMRLAAPLAVISGFGWLLATLTNLAGGLDGVADLQFLHAFAFDTPFGPIVLARLALLAALGAAAALPMPPRPRLVGLTGLAGLLWASQAWLGHAATGRGAAIGAAMLAAYVVHVLAAAAWVGGLMPLLLALREAKAARRETLPRLLHRVSGLATGAVVLILASGIANTLFRIGSAVRDLPATPYGRVLLAKLGLVAAMLALGAYNRLAVARARHASLGPSVAVELAVGAAVLGAAALLGITPPPH